jgi:hypothetical protein
MSGIGELCSAVEQADPQQLTDDIAAGLRAALKNISTARTRLCGAVWDARTSRH